MNALRPRARPQILPLVLSLLFVTSSLIPKNSYAWGALGHQVVAEVGSQLSNTFWAANSNNMGMLTNVPDVAWKKGKTADLEKPTHFFQPDFYFNDPKDFPKFPQKYSAAVKKYSEETVTKNGTATWRIVQLYDVAVEAVKANELNHAVEAAGPMSHYIGDLSQPLHVTKNFDGPNGDKNGIHKFFETDNIKSIDYKLLKKEVTERAKKLLKDQKFMAQFKGDLVSVFFKEANRTYPYIDDVMHIDAQDGRKGNGADKMLELAKDRLAEGAAILAITLQKLWLEAKGPKTSQTVKVKTPIWIAPHYADLFGITNPSASFVSFASTMPEENSTLSRALLDGADAFNAEHDDCFSE